jgi:hypothetical protein
MLTDRSMLSSERLNPAADLDRYRPINKQWMELGDAWKTRRKDCGSEGNRSSTGRPTESITLDHWGSQSLNYQAKNIHRLDLGLPAHK